MNKYDFVHNYHSHTWRCGHALGEDEEYVLAAIKAGFHTLGFSDHIFLMGFKQRGMRGDFEWLDDYVSSISALKEKYKDQIDIHIGFEAEWFGDLYHDYYKWLLSSGKIEYLILGNHMQIDVYEGKKYARFYASCIDEEKALWDYVSSLIDGMKSGLFTYVAHPDLFHMWHEDWDEEAIKASRMIIEAAIEMDLPLEVNMGPSRYLDESELKEENLSYPWAPFWDLASEYGAKVVFGVDAHNPRNYETTSYDFFEEFATKHNLNIINKVELVNPFKNK